MRFKRISKCNGNFIIPKLTKKLEDSYPHLTIELYEIASKDQQMSIMSDSIHTYDSMSIWWKWLNNKDKYNIKDIRAVNINTCKFYEYKSKEDIWTKDESSSKIRLIMQFN